MAGAEESGETIAVYATFPDMVSADRIGSRLVEAGLAACVNLIPGMRSIYRWEGEIERGEEVVAIIKSTRALETELVELITSNHPYDVPAIVTLPLSGGSPAYLDWIVRETMQDRQQQGAG